jgi:hypothetical protein
MAKKSRPKDRHAMILRMPPHLHQKVLRLVSSRIAGGKIVSKNSVICELIENAQEKRP